MRFGISDNCNHRSGEQMFEVTKYEPPRIYVTCRQTGETYMFFVGADGSLTHEGARFDQGNARRAAVAFLAQKVRAA